jgi:hypothetical protein
MRKETRPFAQHRRIGERPEIRELRKPSLQRRARTLASALHHERQEWFSTLMIFDPGGNFGSSHQ